VKKALKIIAVLLVVTVGGAYGWFTYAEIQNRAAAGAPALTAIKSDAEVTASNDGWLIMQPTNGSPTTGVIVYPGAYCKIEGYAQIMRGVAAAGYLVVGINMPFGLSLMGVNSANSVKKAYPEINNWVLIGHSLGGAMAGTYIAQNPDAMDGLIFWDSYPAVSIKDVDIPTTHIHRATLEGEPPQIFSEQRQMYPENTAWSPVPGGIHMYFGTFDGGNYLELWEPKISNEAQLEIVTAATLEGIARAE